MAKEIKPEHLDKEKKIPKGASDKVVDATKKAVVENLDQEEKELEKQEARLEHIEKEVAATEKEVQKQIEKKKAQLIEMPTPEKKEAKEEKPAAPRKERKWDLNPLNWARHIGTRALAGIAGLPSRVAAKVHHIIAKPQQVLDKNFRKDLGKNILRTPKAILTTISGAVYKPHRGKEKFEDNFKDYGKTWGPDADDKNKFVRGAKKATWYAGKVGLPVGGPVFMGLPKFFANFNRGVAHAFHETFEGIRDSKFKRNPLKWNLKSWKYSKTKEAFAKAFSWNRKGMASGKTIDATHLADKHEHKKAA